MWKCILPIFTPFVREVHAGTGHCRKLSRPTKKIRMDMCLCNVRDTKIVLPGNVKIGVNIPFGIDDDSFTCGLTAHYIASLCKTGIINVLEKHDSIILMVHYSTEQISVDYFHHTVTLVTSVQKKSDRTPSYYKVYYNIKIIIDNVR